MGNNEITRDKINLLKIARLMDIDAICMELFNYTLSDCAMIKMLPLKITCYEELIEAIKTCRVFSCFILQFSWEGILVLWRYDPKWTKELTFMRMYPFQYIKDAELIVNKYDRFYIVYG